MLVYVDLEHPRMHQQKQTWETMLARHLKIKYRLEEITGDRCLLVHYADVNPALLQEIQARAVVVSGTFTNWEHYEQSKLSGLYAIFLKATWPTLAFCGGYQLLAQTYGAVLGPIGKKLGPRNRPDEEENQYWPGMQEEHGFSSVQILKPHPLFKNLNAEITVFQAHYWELKTLPSDFQILAKSKYCSIQSIAHQTKPLFGTQFHPEQYNDTYAEGKQILKNFFEIAGYATN